MLRKWTIPIAVAVLLAAGFIATKAYAASATVDFNVTHGQVIELAVGESYTFTADVAADQTFILAQMLSDEQFPGRGVFLNGISTARNATTATLSLTATGKNSTASLPDGVAPVAMVVGVRFPGGIVVGERVDFFIQVP